MKTLEFIGLRHEQEVFFSKAKALSDKVTVFFQNILATIKLIRLWHIGLVTVLVALFVSPNFFQSAAFNQHQKHFFAGVADSVAVVNAKKQINKEIQSTGLKLNKAVPKSYYLVINSTFNTFNLFKDTTLVHQGKCSTGSYLQLEKDEKQKWLFKTPKGMFTIKGKTTNPVWRKPDWAFVEEGMPVPSINDPSRYEYGVLGDYALALGQGYMIHGTLYQRYLGLPVTHGCVRLNDADLELIYKSLEIGSKVFIY